MEKVFACFDVKAAQFGHPMFIPTNGLALRAFADACANQESPMAKYPGDYALYELGTYDPNSGELKALAQPKHIASAAAVIESMKSGVVVKEVVKAEEVEA